MKTPPRAARLPEARVVTENVSAPLKKPQMHLIDFQLMRKNCENFLRAVLKTGALPRHYPALQKSVKDLEDSNSQGKLGITEDEIRVMGKEIEQDTTGDLVTYGAMFKESANGASEAAREILERVTRKSLRYEALYRSILVNQLLRKLPKPESNGHAVTTADDADFSLGDAATAAQNGRVSFDDLVAEAVVERTNTSDENPDSSPKDVTLGDFDFNETPAASAVGLSSVQITETPKK